MALPSGSLVTLLGASLRPGEWEVRFDVHALPMMLATPQPEPPRAVLRADWLQRFGRRLDARAGVAQRSGSW